MKKKKPQVTSPKTCNVSKISNTIVTMLTLSPTQIEEQNKSVI
jgi:hypothetical protein